MDRTALDAGRVRLVTLTYPGESQECGKSYITPRASKVHLTAILKRFRRAFGGCAAIWKLEPQKRGAPHYHLLVFMPANFDLDAERIWWAENWYEVVDSKDYRHRLAGTAVEKIREWNGVTAYAAKYLCKPAKADGWEHPGRWWGVLARQDLPVHLNTIETTDTKALQLRRHLIRYYQHQLSGRYKVQSPIGAKKQRTMRIYLDKDQRQSFLDEEFRIMAYKRKWKTSRGGCTVFCPVGVMKRLMQLVGLPGDG